MIQESLSGKKNAVKAAAMLLACTLLLGGCGSRNTKEETTAQEQKATVEGEELTRVNYMDSQKEIDVNLRKELENGYELENPFVVLNPYGNSPLTALVIFSTEKETAVTVTVKGKEAEDDIKQTFDAGTDHMIPVYGLYAGMANKVIVSTADGKKKELTIETDQASYDPGKMEARMEQEEIYQYDKMTFITSLDGYIYAVDSKGDMRWYRQGNGMPFKQLKNGHIMYCANETLAPMYYKSGLVETDLLGKVYKEYVIPGGVHHDFVEMPNGNLLVASDARDLSSVEDCIIEIDRETGEAVYELDMKDLLNPKDGGSINRTDEDWFHNNGIWYEEESDTILLSARHVDAVIGINKTEKTISYILGDPDGWTDADPSLFFTPKGDNFEWQYAQHQISVRPDGTIMMFDNGAGRTKTTKKEQEVTGDDVYSRVVTYKADTENMTIEQVFEYGKERGKDLYSEWVSGAVCLDNDSNHLWMTFGSHLYNPENGSTDYGPDDMFQKGLEKSTIMVELKDGQPVYELKTGSLSYRSIRIPLYTDAKEHDYESEGIYLGNLGETKEAADKPDLTTLTKEEINPNWTLSYTPVRLSLTGTYELPEGLEEPEHAYLVLKNGEEEKLYSIKQNVTAQEDRKIVSMNGWMSAEGLSGRSYAVFVVVGDKLYETGKKITF